jgi:uncharacterized protein (DUF433 family)
VNRPEPRLPPSVFPAQTNPADKAGSLAVSQPQQEQHAETLLPSRVKVTAEYALLSRISVDANVCCGKPCIRGTRIWVSLILDQFATGETQDAILAEYPQLRRDDMLAALAHGAERSRACFVDLPGQSAA